MKSLRPVPVLIHEEDVDSEGTHTAKQLNGSNNGNYGQQSGSLRLRGPSLHT
jgi:hypothetical protein